MTTVTIAEQLDALVEAIADQPRNEAMGTFSAQIIVALDGVDR